MGGFAPSGVQLPRVDPAMLELNPIRNRIQDMLERSNALRGYL